MRPEPEPVFRTPPPPFQPHALEALTLLLRLFHDLSDVAVTDEADFKREVEARWRLWREIEGWSLPSQQVGGHIEIHLRQDVLNVRVFRGEEAIFAMRILLNEERGFRVTALRFSDAPEGLDIAGRLVRAVSDHGQLAPLESSISAALARRYGRNLE